MLQGVHTDGSPSAGGFLLPTTVMLGAELVIRQSCGVPAAASGGHAGRKRVVT